MWNYLGSAAKRATIVIFVCVLLVIVAADVESALLIVFQMRIMMANTTILADDELEVFLVV
ncbi:hypothetical protein B0H11DRAFT_2247052 [Mycena galericulata]|nr:hypothetical protein B0H11DRAFT_2247052 [Mycena galericulata]